MALRNAVFHLKALGLPSAGRSFWGSQAARLAHSHDHHDEHDHHEEDHDDHDEHDHAPATTPTVFDKLVQITVVDLNGARHTVRGLAGKSLLQALVDYGFPETYFFPNMGWYTMHENDAHVFVPKDFHKYIPQVDPDGDEADAIKRMYREIVQEFQNETSFFASYVPLSSAMNGMTVGIGPIKPWILHPYRGWGGVHDSRTAQFSKPTDDIFG